MKLALYQGPSPCGAVEGAFATVGSMLQAASVAGAGMVVFPELFLPGYNQGDNHMTVAQPRDGPWMTRLAELAAGANCGLTIGWAERDADVVYNAATAFDATGTQLAHYRKIQLFGPMENAAFEIGDAYCVFDLNGLPTALLICYDVEFAPHCRALRQKGVELLLVPTANPLPFTHITDVLIPARASEMNMTIAYANYCGSEGALTYCGGSQITGPDARPLARAGDGEALLIANLDVLAGIDPVLRSTQLNDYLEVKG